MRATTILTLVFLAFVILCVALSLTYAVESSMFPLMVGVPATALLLAELLRNLLRREKTKAQGTEIRGGANHDGQRLAGRRSLEVGAWGLGLVAVTYLLGLAIGLPLFTLAYLKRCREGWLLSLAISVGIFATIYGIFGIGLDFILYKGILLE